MKSERWSPIATLKQSWVLTKGNFVIVFGLLFLTGIITFILSSFGGEEGSARYWIVLVVQMLVAAWLNGGVYKALLSIADEEEPSFSVFQEVMPIVLKLLVLDLLIGVAIYAVPTVVSIVQGVDLTVQSDDLESIQEFYSALFAGYWLWVWLAVMAIVIYLSIRFMFAFYALVDNPSIGVIGAMNRSLQMTHGNMGKLLLVALLLLVINLIGLCLLIVGVFVSMVTSAIWIAVLYRQIDREQQEEEPIVGDENV